MRHGGICRSHRGGSGLFPEIGQTLSAIDQVQEVHYLAGQDCLMVKLRAKDNKELETLLMTRINSIHNVSSTRTHIALSTFKESAKIVINPIS